jgi:hypothetical protein
MLASAPFAQSAVELGDFSDPAPPVPMLHLHKFGLAPVEMKGDKGYLLVELIEGIANYPPRFALSGMNS